MAQVIKVSDELYRLLKEKAAERRITIKEALTETLEEAKTRAAELQSLLTQKIRELKTLEANHEGLKERYNREIAGLWKEIRRLRGELFRYRTMAKELSSALEEQKHRHEAAKDRLEEWERTAFAILPLGLINGLLLPDLLERAFDKGLKELLLPLLGGTVGAAVGNHVYGKPGLLIGATVGLLMGEIASYLWHEWRGRGEAALGSPPAVATGNAQVTRFGPGR